MMRDRRSVRASLVDFFDVVATKSLPDGAVNSTRDRVADTLAVAIAGATNPAISRVRDGVRGELCLSHHGGSHIWGTGETTTATVAALINSAAAHAEDFDDTHTGAVMHGSACVIPAAWSVAELADLDWNQLTRGVVAGWEIAACVGQASNGAFHRRGMHPTSIGGIFGAAYAVCVMRNDSPDTMLNALGLCGSAVSGLNAYLQNGSDGKLMNPGFATRAGIEAANLAMAGVIGPHDIFDGRHGVFEALGDGDHERVRATFATLGHEWEIRNVSVKPFPACHFAHAPIECALDLSNAGVDTACIDHIEVRVPKPTWDLIAHPRSAKLEPRSAYEVRFSLPWLVSLALIDGRLDRASFETGLLERQDVRHLAHRVQVAEWTEGGYPAAFPGEVEITFPDGMSSVRKHSVNLGHPRRPLTSGDIKAKTTACLSGSGIDANSVLSALSMVDPATSVRDLTERIIRPASQENDEG